MSPPHTVITFFFLLFPSKLLSKGLMRLQGLVGAAWMEGGQDTPDSPHPNLPPVISALHFWGRLHRSAPPPHPMSLHGWLWWLWCRGV